MGILTIPCPGRLANGQACTHRFWRILSLPKLCPTCQSPTSPGVCEKCGKPLQFGIRVCSGCAHVAPPPTFDEVAWSIPDGIFARRVDVTLQRNDNRRFLIPAGVSALTLIDGKPRVVPGSAIDYWTVLRAQPTASSVDAERLRVAVEGQVSSAHPRLTVVLVRPGPNPVMLEFGDVPCADGVDMQVQIRAETSVRSVELILRRFLSGETATVSTEEIERRVALEVQAAVMGAISRRTMRDLLEPGSRLKILAEVKDETSRAVAQMGLELSSLAVIHMASERTKEVLEGRADAAVEALQVETIQSRIANDLARQGALLDHAEKVETLEQKKKFVLMQAMTREADTELHATGERERVAQRVRAIEQALRIEQAVSDADLADLIAARSDKSRLDATLRGISQRGYIRDHELVELDHDIAKQRKRDDAARQARIDDAAVQSRLVAELQSQQRGQIEMGRLAKQAELEGKRGEIEITESAADRQHARSKELAELEKGHELRMMELYARLSTEQLMVIRNVSPELASAIKPRDASQPHEKSQLDLVQRVSEAQIKALTEEIIRTKDSNKDALEAIVEAVRAARGGGQSTTNVNVRGRDRS
jgi:hypothetical protein